MAKKDRKITKAVIALAGYGTRFLPATKNQPKQMLPIIDKPIIHYLVEEAVESGIRDVILVTQAGQHTIEDYFDSQYEIESILEEKEKYHYLKIVRDIPQMANFIYVRQKKHLPYGNGTPLLVVQDLIDEDESFVYMFGDDMTLTDGKVPVTKQLIDTYEKYQPSAVIGVQEVPWNEVHKYGTVRYVDNPKVPFLIDKVVEKADRKSAFSNMAQFGRFVFDRSVIETAQSTKPGKSNELWLADILSKVIENGGKIVAQPIDGKWLTTGDPLQFLQTTLVYAMRRPELAEDLRKFIKDNIKL